MKRVASQGFVRFVAACAARCACTVGRCSARRRFKQAIGACGAVVTDTVVRPTAFANLKRPCSTLSAGFACTVCFRGARQTFKATDGALLRAFAADNVVVGCARPDLCFASRAFGLAFLALHIRSGCASVRDKRISWAFCCACLADSIIIPAAFARRIFNREIALGACCAFVIAAARTSRLARHERRAVGIAAAAAL